MVGSTDGPLGKVGSGEASGVPVGTGDSVGEGPIASTDGLGVPTMAATSRCG